MSRRPLLLGAAALIAAWVLVPSGVPLYDGIGFPDEPYRYVQPPAGAKATARPGGAVGTSAAGNGASTDDLDVMSGEQGPQVEIFVSTGELRGPGDARSYRVQGTPIAPAPGGIPIDGNIYRISVGCSARTTSPCAVTVQPPQTDRYVWVALRSTSARNPSPNFLYRPTPAAPWQAVNTDRAGNDIYSTTFVGPGDYALTYATNLPKSATAPASSRRGGLPLTPIVLAAVLAALAVIILVIRFSRRPLSRGVSRTDPP